MPVVRKAFLRSCVLVMALAPIAGQGQPARPGFDCAKARLDVEKEICASPELSQLDAGIASAFATAQQILDASGRAALAVSQKEFIGVRNLGKTALNFNLRDHLQHRHDFLRAIRASKGQWAGSWGNDEGILVLTLRSDGFYDVKADASDRAGGRWTCAFEHGGKASGTMMTTVHRSKDEKEEDPHDGWTLALTRAGDSLKLKARKGPNKSIPMPFCGANGTLEGTYLPVQARKEN